MVDRNPQIANLPESVSTLQTTVAAVESGTFSNTDLTIEPEVTTLGTVTSVYAVPGDVAFYAGGIDMYSIFVGSSYFGVSERSNEFAAAIAGLSPGTVLTLGPSFASTNGLPATVTFSGYWDGGSSMEIFISGYSANYNTQAPNTSATTSYISIPGTTTNIVTDNASLSLSEPYFEIGDNTPIVSSTATVSSGTINLPGDVASSYSAGDLVVEKRYTATPSIKTYNFATGTYVDTYIDGPAYRLYDQIVYNSSGTFDVTAYPKAKAFKFICIGGGGGGAGAASTGSGQVSFGTGGGGGGYASGWITKADALLGGSALEIFVGAGGSFGYNTSNGTSGGNSFVRRGGSTVLLTAGGGFGGNVQVATTPPQGRSGAFGGTGSVESHMFWPETRTGQFSNGALMVSATFGSTTPGGGATGITPNNWARYSTAAYNGQAGYVPGGGGGGGYAIQNSTAKFGGSGASGRVIVEVYV